MLFSLLKRKTHFGKLAVYLTFVLSHLFCQFRWCILVPLHKRSSFCTNSMGDRLHQCHATTYDGSEPLAFNNKCSNFILSESGIFLYHLIR